MTGSSFENSIFFNYPFHSNYRKMRNIIVFTCSFFGYEVCSAEKRRDSSTERLYNILGLIKSCRYGIHDFSWCICKNPLSHPHFNIPYEIGLFTGCKGAGGTEQQSKEHVIFSRNDKDQLKYLSDLSGVEVFGHKKNPAIALTKLVEVLSGWRGHQIITSPSIVNDIYQDFIKITSIEHKTKPVSMTFTDFSVSAKNFLSRRRPGLFSQ